MANQLFQVDELLSTIQVGTFDLSQIHDFPQSEWMSKRQEYLDLASWYNGDWLNEKQMQGGVAVDKYPIKLNPIRGAVYKHAYALFGETKDDGRPLAQPILRAETTSAKESAKKGQDFLSNVWYENHGRSLMLSNAILSQILGGCIFKVSYIPEQAWRRIPIRLETIHPANFIGIPMAGDPYRLEQAWIVKAVSPREVSRVYGMDFPEDQLVYYVEYWTPDYYDITLNGRKIPTGKYDDTGQELMYSGEHDMGGVPIFYIPHIRETGFWGDSLITNNVQGIVQEMNKRVADYGDAVSDDSHRHYILKNTSGRPDVYELTAGVRVIQLPSVPSITGKEQSPDMSTLGDSQASIPMEKLNDQLYQHFRREAFIPAVADGEDEGSQRSALTLAMRMWPLLSHTSMERVYWTDALSLLDGMILRIGKEHSLGGITEELLGMRIERRWAPMLPRDREVFINELVNRAGGNLGSIKHLLSLLDDIEDPEGEWEAIKVQIKEMAEAMPKPIQQPGQQPKQQQKEKQTNA